MRPGWNLSSPLHVGTVTAEVRADLTSAHPPITILVNMFFWRRLSIWLLPALTIAACCRAERCESYGGVWRADIEGARETRSGKGGRDGDSFVAVAIEREWPVFDRAAVGVRVRPLFAYFQHKDSSMIYGTAIGVTARMYGRKHNRTGPFIETGCSALWHSHHFTENGSRVNLWSEIGAGYQFSSFPWYVTIKWHHMSNAGLRNDNAGVDGCTISAGCRF